MSGRDNDEPERRDSLADALKYAQAGTMLIAPMIAIGAVGYFLDRWWGTKPWLLLAGLLLGMIGGFVSFFQLVLPPGRKGGGPGTR